MHLPQWILELGEPELERVCGVGAVLRGTAYFDQDRVRSTGLTGDGQGVFGVVLGSGRNSYVTSVVPSRGRGRWSSTCTCPMQSECKHVVALVLTVQREMRLHAPPPPPWERHFAGLAGQMADDFTDLGLEISWRSSTTLPPRGESITLHPVRLGKQGRWIKTGLTWSNLHHARITPPVRPTQARALEQLARIAQSESGRVYGYGDVPVTLNSTGPLGWTVLRGVVAAGVRLVTPDPEVVVTVEPIAAELSVTVTASADGAVHVRPTVRLGGQLVPGDEIVFVRDAAGVHGILRRVGDALILAPLSSRPDDAVRGLLESPTLDAPPRSFGLRHGQVEPARGPASWEITIPAADAGRFTSTYLPVLRRRVPVTSPDDSVDLPETQPVRAWVDLTYTDNHRLALEWGFTYISGSQAAKLPLLGSEPVRAPAEESALLEEVTDLVAAHLPAAVSTFSHPRRPYSPTVLGGVETAIFTEDVLPRLEAHDRVDVTISGERAAYRKSDETPVIELSISESGPEGERTDWFDLGVSITIGAEDVPFRPLFTALAAGDDHLLLDSGTWFSLERPELDHLRQLIDEARSLHDRAGADGELRLSRWQAGLWEELTELGVVARESAAWQASVNGLLSASTHDELAPPTALVATLRPYQLEGYRWLSFLWDQHLGGILADDMGLGKTLQCLATILRAKESGDLNAPVLIVAPTSVVSTWASEAAKFAPSLRVTTIHETLARRGVDLGALAAEVDIVVTSYALVRLDVDDYEALPWRAMLLDEAQFVKNRTAKTYAAVRRVPAPVKIAITGTPLENSLMDLWSLLSISAPGLFPRPDAFATTFQKPIEAGESPELLRRLHRRVRPLMLRRTKEAVASELPPKVEQVVAVQLSAAHRRLYDRHLQRERQRVLGMLDDLQRNRVAIFQALTTLRQLALAPELVDPESAVPSSKLDVVIDDLRELAAEGHRALVFSQFTGFLALLRARLEKDGIEYSYLDGRTRNRAQRIEEFRSGSQPVFLISLKAGGFGLTLTEADYVFVLDPWWNPAAEQQAIDRTHRIGQDKTVMVYRLVAENTIEDKVVALQERKRALFDQVVSEGGTITGAMTADDLRGLFDD